MRVPSVFSELDISLIVIKNPVQVLDFSQVFRFFSHRYDVILSAETIYKPANYGKLAAIFKEFLADNGQMYPLLSRSLFNKGTYNVNSSFMSFYFHLDTYC